MFSESAKTGAMVIATHAKLAFLPALGKLERVCCRSTRPAAKEPDECTLSLEDRDGVVAVSPDGGSAYTQMQVWRDCTRLIQSNL